MRIVSQLHDATHQTMKLTFAQKLNLTRRDLKLTQPEAAKRLGVSSRTYWAIENGTKSPANKATESDMLEKIATVPQPAKKAAKTKGKP